MKLTFIIKIKYFIYKLFIKLLNICITAEADDLIRKHKSETIVEVSFYKFCRIIVKLEALMKEYHLNVKDFLFFIVIMTFYCLTEFIFKECHFV